MHPTRIQQVDQPFTRQGHGGEDAGGGWGGNGMGWGERRWGCHTHRVSMSCHRHDYNFDSVKKAVDEFTHTNNLKIANLYPDTSWVINI
jgi:hypothetical protein